MDTTERLRPPQRKHDPVVALQRLWLQASRFTEGLQRTRSGFGAHRLAWRRTSVSFFVGLALGPLAQVSVHAATSDESIAKAMALAVDQWVATQRKSGLLLYGFDFLEGAESEPDHLSGPQLVRQALAASTWADYVALTGDKDTREPLARLIGGLQARGLPFGKSRLQGLIESTRVLSLPVGRFKLHAALDRSGLLFERTGPGRVLVPGTDYSQAHTGATALALLAEVRYAGATGDQRFADSRRAWLEALIGLRIPGEGFRKMPTSIDHTPYYDGESWLALAEYHRAFPQDPRAASALADADADLLGTYGSAFQFAFFHWGTMAAAARYADTRDPRFLTFVTMQMTALLQRKAKPDHLNNCALLEGVADGLGVLVSAGQGEGDLAKKARAWIERETDKALRLQIQPGQTTLTFANAQVTAPRMSDFAGAFLGGVYRPMTQVDLAGHCVSAMVKIQRQALLP